MKQKRANSNQTSSSNNQPHSIHSPYYYKSR
nr:MAG TPA: hypothetical protein [Caudoviricetes sp.]